MCVHINFVRNVRTKTRILQCENLILILNRTGPKTLKVNSDENTLNKINVLKS